MQKRGKKDQKAVLFLVQNQIAWNAVTPKVQEMSLFKCNELLYFFYLRIDWIEYLIKNEYFLIKVLSKGPFRMFLYLL